MTSLVMTSYRPYKPIGGAPLRNWQNIRALSALGPVDVVSVGVEDHSEELPGVREWAPFSFEARSAWDRAKTTLSPLRPGVYPGIDLFHAAPVASWIRERSARQRYDIAVIETLSLAAYLPDLKLAAKRVVFDAHNVESALHQSALDAESIGATPLRRLKNRVLRNRLAATESGVIRGSDAVWVCSEADAREIETVYGRRDGVTVVPNAVDVESYRKGDDFAAADWSGTPVTMIYPGLFRYTPNEDAALRLVREVLPAVRGKGFDARVVLVGRDPTPALLEAARVAGGVEVTGAVETVLPYLRQPCVVTLPIALGSGTRLKILEAFAAGAPVVSTAKGSEGIEARDGEQLLIRERTPEMADAVIEIWRDASLRRRLHDRALALVRERYSWSAAAQSIGRSLGVPISNWAA